MCKLRWRALLAEDAVCVSLTSKPWESINVSEHLSRLVVCQLCLYMWLNLLAHVSKNLLCYKLVLLCQRLSWKLTHLKNFVHSARCKGCNCRKLFCCRSYSSNHSALFFSELVPTSKLSHS